MYFSNNKELKKKLLENFKVFSAYLISLTAVRFAGV